MNYYRVVTGDKIRFESVYLNEAEAVAKRLYRQEGEIPDIFEMQKFVVVKR